MTRALVPLAPGFEEIEAVTMIDLLRRAGIEVVVAGLASGPVRASRNTVVRPDVVLETVADQEFDLIALPGGLPGADNLAEDATLADMLLARHERRGLIGAICAAPKVLARHGILDGLSATSFPGVLDEQSAPRTRVLDDPVVVDGHVVTSRGPGTAMDFALELIEILEGEAARVDVENALQRPGAR